MKNLSGTILGAVAFTMLGASGVQAQALAVSLTGTYSAGSAYAYGQVTSDYATGYYYSLCVYLTAYGEEDDGTWDFYDAPSGCGYTDAEESWSFSTDGTTDFVEFAGENVEYIDYYVYQVDEYCGLDGYSCEDYWDAYEDSLIEGADCGGGASWTLYGPPAIAYVAAQIEQSTIAYAGDLCVYPYSETSEYNGMDSDDYYEAHYWAYLNEGDFTGRYVIENVSGTYEDCSLLGVVDPITVENADFNNGYDWVPDGDEYGFDDWDYVGVSIGYAEAVQGVIGSSSCWAFNFSQAMKIASCLAPTIPSLQYDNGHTLATQMFGTYIMTYRGGASGRAQ